MSGLQNGETQSVLGVGLLCVTAANTVSPVGDYASDCVGAIDNNYAISYFPGTVTVQPAPLMITAGSESVNYGSSPPAIAALYSGFVNGDTAASLTTPPTCSTTDTASSPVGTYPTTCSGASDAKLHDHLRSWVNSGGRRDGDDHGVVRLDDLRGNAPDNRPELPGFVNGDTAASLTTPPTCTTAATSSSSVGSYPSTCAGASDSNYAFNYVAGSVQVNPAPLSVTAASAAMTYGGTVPTASASYSGFVNGDTVASLTTPPTCTTTASSSSSVGSYATTCSGAVDTNYSITYVAGSVQVNPALLSVTASSAAMTYGGTAPTVAASYSGFVNGEHRGVAHHPTDVHHHGDVVEPSGRVPKLVFRCRRCQLLDFVRGRDSRDRERGPRDQCLLGFHDLRRNGAHGLGVVQRIREWRNGGFAHHPTDVHHRGDLIQLGG